MHFSHQKQEMNETLEICWFASFWSNTNIVIEWYCGPSDCAAFFVVWSEHCWTDHLQQDKSTFGDCANNVASCSCLVLYLSAKRLTLCFILVFATFSYWDMVEDEPEHFNHLWCWKRYFSYCFLIRLTYWQ